MQDWPLIVMGALWVLLMTANCVLQIRRRRLMLRLLLLAQETSQPVAQNPSPRPPRPPARLL